MSLSALKRNLGREVRELCKQRKWSQEVLALQCDLHPNEVGRIERGEANPTVETLFSIASELKTDVPRLFSGAVTRR